MSATRSAFTLPDLLLLKKKKGFMIVLTVTLVTVLSLPGLLTVRVHLLSPTVRTADGVVPSDGTSALVVEDSTGARRSAARTNITVLCHFIGEMGNNLDMYAHCHILATLLQSRMGIRNAKIALRQSRKHQAVTDLMECFPHFQNVNFTDGSDPVYDDALKRQREILIERYGPANAEAGAAVTEAGALVATVPGVQGFKDLGSNPFVTTWTRYEPSDVLQELRAFVDRAIGASAADCRRHHVYRDRGICYCYCYW
jgi:hypothetical protein